jgi:putative endonuclease
VADAKRVRAYRGGLSAERWAALSLMLKGFRIVARRLRTPLGEIDLIARRGRLVLIVEVKRRPTLREAMDAVTPAAQRRIENAADLWLSRQRDSAALSIRFDLVAVLPRRWPVHVPGVFEGRN